LKLGVFYHIIEHKIVNGSLFYAFEYFEFLNKFEDTYLFLFTNNDHLENILKYLKQRYTSKNWNKIIQINNIKELYNCNVNKALFLDTRSFHNIYCFLKTTEVLVYNSSYVFNKTLPKSKLKNIYYFGYYYYQDYEIQQLLQINFECFKDIDKSDNKTFISSGTLNDKLVKNIIQDYNDDKYLLKDNMKFYNNIFESFDKLIYIHNFLDTNNRLIVESFYYGKEVEYIHYNSNLRKDSSFFRYLDCKAGNIKKYYLTKDNKIIKKMLEKI